MRAELSRAAAEGRIEFDAYQLLARSYEIRAQQIDDVLKVG